LFFCLSQVKKEYEFKLFTAENTLGCILPERVIDEAYQNKVQNLIFYDSLMNKANQVARIHQVTYVYALILKMILCFLSFQAIRIKILEKIS